MKHFFTCWIFILLMHTGLPAQVAADWESLTSVEDVCRAYPDRMKALLEHFDLEKAGLEAVHSAFEEGELILACHQLLQYYKDGQTASYLRESRPEITADRVSIADSLDRGIFTFYTQTDEVSRLPDGRLDWSYTGPADDIEWAWGLNRHSFLLTLLNTYLKSGNPKYARAIDRYVKDWVISSLPYPGVKSRTAMWRGLEVSFRVKRWAEVFYGLMESEEFSPATRLLLLSSIPEHAHYLREFHAQGNWLTMELSALARAATAWPELRKAGEWLEYTQGAMTASLLEQVYPDGVQTELTAHYHRVALSNFDLFREIFNQAEVPLPEVYTQKIEEMWNYLAYSLRPSGTNPLNNDSDLRNYQQALNRAAADFDRPDWLYIATNGQSGNKPEESSVFFPYAGQAILRSGWDQAAHWAFFDIGPWGSGHQHSDKLHLSISAFGRDLLVDGGRFAYRGDLADKFRAYAVNSASHNLLLIDGHGQAPGPKETEAALDATHFRSTVEWDYAWGSFDQFKETNGKAEHTRSLTYVKNKFWIVVDRLKTDRPRDVEVLWHWHPDCSVQKGRRRQVTTDHETGNLRIIPLGKQKWELNLIKGQESPDIQGWYSEAYNSATPNIAAVYRTQTRGDVAFIWLLLPSKAEPQKVKTRIIESKADGVQLRVRLQNEQYDLFVPFADSTQLTYRSNP